MSQSDDYLIICDSLIGDKNAGQKLLRDILANERMYGVISTRRSSEKVDKFYLHIRARYFREHRWLYYINRFPGVLILAYVRMLLGILRNIQTLKKLGSMYMVILRGDAILMSYVILRITKKRFVVFIPDGLKSEVRDGYIYDRLKSHCFHWLLDNCCGYYGASKHASEVYTSLREKKFLGVLRPAFPWKSCAETAEPRKSDKLKILYAGSSYALETIKCFAEVLSSFDHIEFYVAMEGDYKLDSIGKNITYLGWLSQQELDVYADKMDMFYMPYSFKSRDRERMIVGYPGKLGNYLALNRNIIFHAPEYSSVFREFNLIVPEWCLSSLNATAIKLFISSLNTKGNPLLGYYNIWKKESSLERNLNHLSIEENSRYS